MCIYPIRSLYYRLSVFSIFFFCSNATILFEGYAPSRFYLSVPRNNFPCGHPLSHPSTSSLIIVRERPKSWERKIVKSFLCFCADRTKRNCKSERFSRIRGLIIRQFIQWRKTIFFSLRISEKIFLRIFFYLTRRRTKKLLTYSHRRRVPLAPCSLEHAHKRIFLLLKIFGWIIRRDLFFLPSPTCIYQHVGTGDDGLCLVTINKRVNFSLKEKPHKNYIKTNQQKQNESNIRAIQNIIKITSRQFLLCGLSYRRKSTFIFFQ